MKIQKIAYTALSTMIVAMAANAGNDDLQIDDVLMKNTSGCMEGPTAEFGRYIGDWTIEDEGLAQDGSGWQAGNGARWLFTCVGDGIAVQDFWMPNGPLSEDGTRGPAPGVGTNLRIYDPATESWQIAWTATQAKGFTHIGAKKDENDNIVMHFIAPEQTPPRRITFFAPTETGWNWKMEMQIGGSDSWTEVYRIKAPPRGQ